MRPSDPVCRRACRIGAAFVALALSAAATAQPAGYPNRPLRVVVPFPAGGPIDVPARLVAQRLSETMGQQFVIDNRAGASGRIGTEFVAKAPRDGYTLLFTHSSHTSNVSQFRKLPYDSVADFAPITQVNRTSGNVLVVHPSVPARTVKELIALAKARPGELNYASAGVGSPPHVGAALFVAMAGVQITHVPYKSTVAGLTDVLGGRAELIVSSPSFALPFIKAERLRALGATGPRRIPELPEVPTVQEAGLAGYEFASWHGMWFPAGVPSELVRRVQTEVARALAAPEIRKQFVDGFLIPVGSTPEEFAEFIKKDLVVQADIVKKIGLEPE
jgi:tripartite-type tricarboxylate transporter receptor subunit TctC